jgi:hypothetical protein
MALCDERQRVAAGSVVVEYLQHCAGGYGWTWEQTVASSEYLYRVHE